MRIRTLYLVALACYAAVAPAAASAQTYPVKAKFEVDGKASSLKFRVLLYADGAPIEPTVSDEGEFYVPALDVEWVDVRLISGRHDLLYKRVHLKKLYGTLVFGIMEKLSGEAPSCKPGKKLMKAYYLKFHPDDTVWTELFVTVCK